VIVLSALMLTIGAGLGYRLALSRTRAARELVDYHQAVRLADAIRRSPDPLLDHTVVELATQITERHQRRSLPRKDS
jgi:HAMP domain-containing protein